MRLMSTQFIKRWLSKPVRLVLLAIAATSLTLLVSCATSAPKGEVPPGIETTSGTAEVALAEHLADIGAKKYGAWWCPHCHDQQALFGKEAFAKVTYVECDPEGQNSQTAACQETGIEGFPTWEINGELYPGIQQLPDLASISGYSGPMDFQIQLPQ